jgi:hypothetical protein
MRKLGLPAALIFLILVTAGKAPSLTDMPGGTTASGGVTLSLPRGYVILSPLSRTLDALTLLSAQQSIALIASVVVVVVAWQVIRKAKLRSAGISLAMTLLILGALEAAAAFLPRSMASLTVNDPDIVRVDFHSHTGASHDVRKSFSAEDNREWHRAGGFDIAYVTDHVKFSGAEAALARNPNLAGDGTSLITGMEGRYHRMMSTIVLGITALDSALLNKRGNILPGRFRSPRHPVTIIAIPNRNLDSLSVRVRDSVVALPNLAAIELVDAAPRGLAQLDREERRIRILADDLRLALVAGSNNHGYGRTVAAWNLMPVPGWRGMPPESVAAMIEDQLRTNRESVRIVHRSRSPLHGAKVAAVLPEAAYRVLGGLSRSERISWILWICCVTALFAVTVAARKRAAR